MAKRRAKTETSFAPDITRRLEQVGPHEISTGPGLCEIRFGQVDVLSSDLATFEMVWSVGASEPIVPSPNDRLFDIWERYRARHRDRCEEYKRRLFDIYTASELAAYEDWQWKALKRKRPTAADLSGVVSRGTVARWQTRSNKRTDYEVRVTFAVYWDAHGVEFKLDPEADGFPVVSWAAGEV